MRPAEFNQADAEDEFARFDNRCGGKAGVVGDANSLT